MTTKSLIQSAVNLPLGWFGLRLSRIAQNTPSQENYRHFMPTCLERLRHARKLGFAPRVIVDGGAFKGEFAKQTSEVFPGVQLIMVEPNPFVQAAIRENTAQISPPPVCCQVALSDGSGKATFNIWGDPEKASGASLLGHVRGEAERAIEVSTDSIDSIVGRLGLRPD